MHAVQYGQLRPGDVTRREIERGWLGPRSFRDPQQDAGDAWREDTDDEQEPTR